MFNVTHRNDFVTQKVSRQRSFSVWTRAWTRLVVDTPRVNMSVESKHRKLWDNLYTDTSSHEKICTQTRACKSKSCAEGRFYTVNTHHSHSRGSNQWSLTWFRMWKVAYIHVLPLADPGWGNPAMPPYCGLRGACPPFGWQRQIQIEKSRNFFACFAGDY